MAIDIRSGNRVIRIISVYLPHVGYPWADFELEKENIYALAMEGKDQGKYNYRRRFQSKPKLW